MYQTDFEDVTKLDAYHLSMSLKNYLNMSSAGNADTWMEGLDRNSGVPPHSGTRCVGMETTNTGSRNELIIFPATLGSGLVNEFFIREWLYLPADWQVLSSDWCHLFQLTDENPPNYWPFIACVIHDTKHNGIVDLVLHGRDVNGVAYDVQTVKDFTLPRGKWFKFEWYTFRDPVNGMVKCWINDQLIFDASGLNTKAVDNYHVETAKVYHDGGGNPYRLWLDDLEVWDTIPGTTPPTPPTPPSPLLLIGGILLLVILLGRG